MEDGDALRLRSGENGRGLPHDGGRVGSIKFARFDETGLFVEGGSRSAAMPAFSAAVESGRRSGGAGGLRRGSAWRLPGKAGGRIKMLWQH